MKKQIIRVWKELDVEDIQDHLLVLGELSGSCNKCSEVGLKECLNACPKCGTDFRYVAFRSPETNFPKLMKLKESRPDLIFVDYNDFKRVAGSLKAKEFFK
ncbi:MAG: hypothetical protein ACOY3D_03460 [Candidatus Omnitrophota bacterium]